jgi:hypothetical protein
MIGMQVAFTIAQMLVRISGVLLLILGLLIWAEGMFGLIPLHMLLGLVFVISVWVLAFVSFRMGAPLGLTSGVALIGLLVLILGMTQTSLLPGPNHYLIQILHLLLGMAAVAMAEVLGGRVRRLHLAPA